jgi:hypothetical protein
MPLRAVVDSSVLREAAKRVKQIDPEIKKGFVRDLKTDLKPYARSIAGDVPTLGRPGAMRGFGHAGRTRWTKVTGSSYVTPGGGRGSLARIEIYGSGATGRAAFKMADLAGTQNDYGNGLYAKLGSSPWYLINGQGQDMVSRLADFGKLSAGGKGGRFAWAGFMKHRPKFVQQAITRLDQYSDEINRRFFR